MIPKSLDKYEIEYRILIVDEDQKTALLTKKSLEKPYVGDICKHEEIDGEMFKKLADDEYLMLIIDNNNGLGFGTLMKIREVDENIPIIYRSTDVNERWIKSGIIWKFDAHLHETSQTTGQEVNSLIQQYIEGHHEEK